MSAGAAGVSRLRLNLTWKLAGAGSGELRGFCGPVGYLSLREHRRHSEELVLQSADRVTDLIQRSTRYQMLHNDREALYQMIKALGSEPGMRRMRDLQRGGEDQLLDRRGRSRQGRRQAGGGLLQLPRARRRRSPAWTGPTARASSPSRTASACWG